MNLETFYTVALWTTVIYFVAAWFGLQRSKRVIRNLAREHDRSGPPTDESVHPKTRQSVRQEG